MRRIMAVVLLMALTGCVMAAQAQQGTATATTTKSLQKKKVLKASGPAISEQLSEMKQAIDAQQQQIKQLSDQVQGRDQQIQQLQQRLDQSQAAATQAQTKADAAASQAAQQEQAVTTIKSDVADLKTNNTNAALSLQETQRNIRDTLETKLSDLAHGKVKIGGDVFWRLRVLRAHRIRSAIHHSDQSGGPGERRVQLLRYNARVYQRFLYAE